MGSVKEDTIKSVKWTAVEKVSVQGIQFLLGLIMARLLTPEDYGIVGMLSIFIAISSTFIDSGFSSALIRKNDRTEEDFCTVFYFNIIIAIICYALLFVAAPWVADFFHIPLLCPILRIQSIALILNSLIGVQTAKLTIDLNFKALAQRSVIASLLSGILGVILAYFGWGVWALVAQTLLCSLINLIFIWIYCRWAPSKEFNKASFRYLWNFGSKLLASGLLNTIYSNLSPLVIGRYFSARDLGVYSRGSQLASYPSSITTDVLGKVTYPILAKIQDDESHLIHVYRKYICVTSMIIFFGCVLMAAVAKPLVLFVLTAKWKSCIIYLQIFCFAIMFDHICKINLNLLEVKGRSDLFFRLEVIKKIISVAILFASIPFGVIGICVSKVIYTQIAVFINTYYTGKLFHLGYLAQLKDFIGFLAKAVIACVPAYLFTFLNLSPILSLSFGCLSAIMLYWLMLRKNNYMIELLGIVKAKLYKR